MTKAIFKIKDIATSSEEVDGISMPKTMKSIGIGNTSFLFVEIKMSTNGFIACFSQGPEAE